MKSMWSNDWFWNELKPKLRQLIPHCDSETYSAYLMMFRVIQVIVCGDYKTGESCVPNDGVHEHVTRPWDRECFHTYWQANISGIDYVLERISTISFKRKDDGVYVLTTEYWEAVLEFKSDWRAGYQDASYFTRIPTVLVAIQIIGDVESMCNDMLMAALSVPSLETGEVFYKGSPI
jgi:hypothetical protein